MMHRARALRRDLSAIGEQFSILHDCAGAPQEISPASIVVGAARGSQFCFAAQGINGALSLCPSGDQSTPPNRTWQGGAAAVAWNDGISDRFDIMVRAVGPGTDETSIQHATWRNSCTGQPQWSSARTPPSGVAPGRYSVSAAVKLSPTGVQTIVLVAAGNDGKLYENRFVDKWGTWTKIAAPADTIGQLGGVHVAPQNGTFFVGFRDHGAPRNLRSGGFAVAASGKEAGHIFAAFQFKEGTLGTPTCSVATPFDIAFMESADGGITWSNPLVITTRPDEVGTDQFMPSVASHDDGTILITYYDRSVDPNGSRVQERVAVRRPGGTWIHGIRRNNETVLTDLALLPRKCNDGATNQFIGDYHWAVGGKTHAHALRVDALPLDVGPTIRLQSSAFSGSSWR